MFRVFREYGTSCIGKYVFQCVSDATSVVIREVSSEIDIKSRAVFSDVCNRCQLLKLYLKRALHLLMFQEGDVYLKQNGLLRDK